MQIKDYQVVLLGIMIALGSVASTYILSKAVVDFQKIQTQTIKVTGSASQNVNSDRSSWSFTFRTTKPTLKDCYAKLNQDKNVIVDFLKANNINEEDVEFGTIGSNQNYKRTSNGYDTNEIVNYSAWRNVTVKSNETENLSNVSKNVDTLIDKNIDLSSGDVQYFVSNLDDIKVKMVGEAAKNAQERAKSMVSGTNGKIGTMNSARMGVFQIVPVDSTDVSDYGYNDTSSKEKKVVATVSATFTVK